VTRGCEVGEGAVGKPRSFDGVFNDEQQAWANAIVAKYPNERSAVLPLLFLAQSVEGYVSENGMRTVADIVGLTPAQVLASASFYTMLKKRPQGDYLISVCRNVSCTHMGARKVIQALSERLGIEEGGVTPDGKFSLESAECLATCDGAPSMQINYDDFLKVEPAHAVELVDKLERGEDVLSAHGEIVKTALQISFETATSGARLPGGPAEESARTVGGESQPADIAPDFRPKLDPDEERSQRG
jgi:NADH-quinone oxidoreductase subunit E